MVHLAGGFAIIPYLLDIRSNLGCSEAMKGSVGIGETGGCRASPDKGCVSDELSAGRRGPRDGPPTPPFRVVLHERRPRPCLEGPEVEPMPLGAAASAGVVRLEVGQLRGHYCAGAIVGIAPPRVLLAEHKTTPEARIELRSGALAGASINVAADPSGVLLRLAAPTEAAHRALAVAVDRARLLLGTRGIVVRAERVVETGVTEARRRADRERGR